ncbi:MULTISPECIES: carboxylesterase family protein [unclassified Caballeronia]|uniref:carboxylesterase family protein n=1 Tax=unclassified Caballeronia TaxID=2646786 RepID=UPI0032F09100
MKAPMAPGLASAIAARACSSGFYNSEAPVVPKSNRGTAKSPAARRPWRVLQGQPFSSSPTNSLRWTPPQPAQPWQGTKVATASQSSCVCTGAAMRAPTRSMVRCRPPVAVTQS